jgi:uncharacterized Zn finger protein
MEDDAFDFDDEESSDGVLDETIDAECPYCGETVELILDAGGGRSQDYVEDCEVCCRPWRVRLEFDDDGGASVTLEPVDDL